MGNPAKLTRIIHNNQIITFRSMVESKWFLFLDKAIDVFDIRYEPEEYRIDFQWIPDMAFCTYPRIGTLPVRVLAEIKYDTKWKRKQYVAAMQSLKNKSNVNLIVLLDGEGFVYTYDTPYVQPERHRVKWEELQTAYHRDNSTCYARLKDPLHSTAGHFLKQVDFSTWRLFPK